MIIVLAALAAIAAFVAGLLMVWRTINSRDISTYVEIVEEEDLANPIALEMLRLELDGLNGGAHNGEHIGAGVGFGRRLLGTDALDKRISDLDEELRTLRRYIVALDTRYLPRHDAPLVVLSVFGAIIGTIAGIAGAVRVLSALF